MEVAEVRSEATQVQQKQQPRGMQPNACSGLGREENAWFLRGDTSPPDPEEAGDLQQAGVKQMLHTEETVHAKDLTLTTEDALNGDTHHLEANATVQEKWQAFSWCLLEDSQGPGDEADRKPAVYVQFYPDWTTESARESLALHNGLSKVLLNTPRESQRMTTIVEVVRSRSIMQHIIVPPTSDVKVGWNMIGVLFLTIDLLITPLNMFVLGSPADDVLEMFSYCSFSYWVCDMILQFISGYELHGQVEMRPSAIAWAYLSSRFFVLDFVLILTDVGLFLMSSLQVDALQSVRMFRSLRLMRFLRLLRVGKLKKLLVFLSQRFTNIYVLTAMKVASGLAMMLVVNHFIACAFIWISELEPDGKSWRLLAGLENEGFGVVYTCALHWSLTQFMPATNNIAPDNVAERLFAVVVIVLAMGVFSSFISSITNAVTSMRAVTEAARREGTLVRQFFNERSLSTKLYTKVVDYHRHSGTFQDRIQESAVKSLRELPEKLKVQLHEEVYLPTIRTAVWIQTNGIVSLDQMFFSQLCHCAVGEHVTSPSSDVFLPDTDCAGAIIVTGGCWVYQLADSEKRQEVEIQAWLCEISLWGHWIHRGRLISEASSTYCSVDGCRFSKLSMARGGAIHRYLRTVGLLLAGEIERLSSDHVALTDMSLEDEVMEDLAGRALRFVQLKHPGGFPTVARKSRMSINPWATKD
eukprot:TRINITY_DN25265_c0_g1_i1.p1 TRINITY_DN25265_c0_g1~~TRINITY_DN25265_c0_g1_i1.p1  ORF type:complete len:772 (-),score=109.74 TRINITY_DN25265_c0_g1_i1:51-2138(-)